MIVVVADDLTGAAEVAGVGLAHGLNVEIDIEGYRDSSAELLVIAADTRSKPIPIAIEEITKLSKEIRKGYPELVYKKIDSVLRGHVLEESAVMVGTLGMKGAIIVPANPALDRVIIDGKYFINGEPLEKTGFSQDPEFNISTSSVRELLNRNGNGLDFSIIKPLYWKEQESLILGEASSIRDLEFWAKTAGDGYLPCGAAGFFQSILNHLGKPVVNYNHKTDLPEDSRKLYICGSTFQGSRNKVADVHSRRPYVKYMPGEVFWDHAGYKSSYFAWVKEVVETIEEEGKVIVAVSEPISGREGISNRIKSSMAALVKDVFESTRVDDLLIEGGGTASAVLSNIGLTRLAPLYQFERGVIRMKAENISGLYLTLKPGSYQWPDTVWKF